MRPCRLAGPASATRLHWPVTKSLTSMASPTAKMSGSLVCMCSSTRMPPRSPISRPAAFASVVSGRTPIARITTSAGCVFPDAVFTSRAPPSSWREAGHAVVEDEADAVSLHVLLDEARDLRVQWVQDLVPLLDERHLEAEVDEVLRHLEADEAAADDHRARRGLDELDPRVPEHPRQEARAPFDPLADRLDVRNGPHVEDPRQVDARERRTDRRRPGREDELVVRLRRHLAGLDVLQVDGLLLRGRWRPPRSPSARRSPGSP